MDGEVLERGTSRQALWVVGGLVAAVFIAYTAFSGPSPPQTPIGNQYETAWRTDVNIPMARALVKNKVRGCGQNAYRANIYSSQELLVYCSSDGRIWTSWVVSLDTETVRGPFAPDPSLPLPQ